MRNNVVGVIIIHTRESERNGLSDLPESPEITIGRGENRRAWEEERLADSRAGGRNEKDKRETKGTNEGRM